ncbi:MAG: cyclopropane-fatty-acyl-phospholipid synthase family protein [Acidimicrobiales bacterium]|jgi:cyclopropane-fatty-acyl-phospholipid synthase|nr:cyclopropane-fatty-acyl-phospholipid synthase family protein [Acidimicrobiales bacterium]
MAVAPHLASVINDRASLRIEAYDGSASGPPDAPTRIVVRRREALARLLNRPGELGLVRAFVAGDVDLEGDLDALLETAADVDLRFSPRDVVPLLAEVGTGVLRPPPPPAEEIRLKGTRHSKRRDREAISHHYDVSNEFYRLVLGPTMVYSCALWASPEVGLEAAQTAKLDLVCRKLGLAPGMRLLDVGCGWGSMVIHAAEHYGVSAVGITISVEQAELARRRVKEAHLEHLVEIRVQDYRDVVDGPYDAISSIGMFEHVGRRRLEEYTRDLYALLPPEGRLLNHAIARPGYPQGDGPIARVKAFGRRLATAVGSDLTSRIESDLMQRYVFPDGELHEVGVVISMLQENGFEVRHLESLREHYALTLRQWVANLEANWDEAVREVGEGRARVWRLYMAASAINFTLGGVQVHQVLAVKPGDGGSSGLALRPSFETPTGT